MKSVFRWIINLAIVILLSTLTSYAWQSAIDSRAAEILRETRQVLGGEARLAEIHNFSIAGKIAPTNTSQAASQNFKFVFVTDETKSPNEVNEDINVFIGKEPPQGEGIQKRMMIKERGKVEGGADGDKEIVIIRRSSQDGDKNPNVEENVEIHTITNDPNLPSLPPPIDVPYFMMAMLLKTTPDVSFHYIGDAENGTADLLEVKNDHIQARLSISKDSHLPIALSYQSKKGNLMMIRTKSANSQTVTVEKHVTEPSNEESQEITLRFSDHRMVDGVLLPHHIIQLVNGEIKQEYDVEKYGINADEGIILHKRHK